MHQIQILSSDVANKIAAGEVVQRPLSVVKELVENAIDAGAKKVNVSLKDSGLTQIRVKDDGIGMSRSNLELALVRHATSKVLNEADIFRIMTLGFRGEALASIAAVSKLKIESSVDGNVGYELLKEGDQEQTIKPVGANKGTTVTVDNLFFNTPARFKHLSSTFYELSLIVNFMHKVALTNSKIKFELTNNDNVLFQTYGDGNIQNIFKEVYSTEVARQLKEVSSKNEHYEIIVNLVKPEITRSKKNNIYISINDRIVRNYAIEKMIIDGYGKFLHTNQFPIVYLDIKVDYGLVDVNIHPTKEQIKLSLIDKLEELVVPTIRDALMEEEYIAKPSLDPKSDVIGDFKAFESENAGRNNEKSLTAKEEKALEEIFPSSAGKPETNKAKSQDNVDREAVVETGIQKSKVTNAAGSSFNTVELMDTINSVKEMNLNEPDADYTYKDNPPKKGVGETGISNVLSESIDSTTAAEVGAAAYKGESSEINKLKQEVVSYEQSDLIDGTSPVIDNKLIPHANFVGIHAKTYLLFENDKGLYLVDQHAAQERIRYELISNQFKERDYQWNQLLIPVLFDFKTDEFLKFEEGLEDLEKIGLKFEVFGSNMIRLVEADSWYLKMKNPERDIRNILDLFADKEKISYDEYLDSVAIMMACKSSIKAHHYLNREESMDLLNQLSQCLEAYTCPHGRPIIVNFSEYEIEKMFKRTF